MLIDVSLVFPGMCVQMENIVFFFAELALLQYGLVQSKPSMVAACCLCGQAHPEEDPSVDRHSEAPHWLH